MSFLFSDCISLASIPDISDWDTLNVINMSFMFYNCTKIINIPDISKWKISKCNKNKWIFFRMFFFGEYS